MTVCQTSIRDMTVGQKSPDWHCCCMAVLFNYPLWYS